MERNETPMLTEHYELDFQEIGLSQEDPPSQEEQTIAQRLENWLKRINR